MENLMIYHGGNRGVRRGLLFETPEDYALFRKLLSYYSEKLGVALLITALMPNHDHLLYRALRKLKTEFLRRLHWEYAWKYNQATRRSGHVFEERSWSFERWGNTITPIVIGYICANPELGGLGSFEDYPYTDFQALMGWAPAPSYLDRSLALGFFSSDLRRAPHVLWEDVKFYVSNKKRVLASRARWERESRGCARSKNRMESIDLMTLTAADLERSLQAAVGDLRKEDLMLLAMDRFDGVSVRMIAAALDVRPASLHVRLRELREHVGKNENLRKQVFQTLDQSLALRSLLPTAR